MIANTGEAIVAMNGGICCELLNEGVVATGDNE